MNNDSSPIKWNPNRRPSETIKRRRLYYEQEKGPLTSYGINRHTNENGSSTYAHHFRNNKTGNIITFTNFVPGNSLPSKKRKNNNNNNNNINNINNKINNKNSNKNSNKNKKSKAAFNSLMKLIPSNNKNLKNKNNIHA